MISGSRLLQTFDEHQPAPVLAATGLVELDDLTDGLQAGHVWVITGTVGEGRTTLLNQLAVAVAARGHAAQLVCPREPAAWTTRRLLSNIGRTPVSLGAGLTGHPVRLTHARETLTALPLTVFAGDTRSFTPETDPYAEPSAAAVLVDDADLVGGMTPGRARQLADAGRLVAVTLPRELVLDGPGDSASMAPQWGRVSDVVLEVRTRTIGNIERAPRPAHIRPGEADLVVHRHRWGHTRTLHAAASFHYAAFRDLSP